MYIVFLNFYKNVILNDVRILRLIFDFKYVSVSLKLECIIIVYIMYNYIVNVLGNWYVEWIVYMFWFYYCLLWCL